MKVVSLATRFGRALKRFEVCAAVNCSRVYEVQRTVYGGGVGGDLGGQERYCCTTLRGWSMYYMVHFVETVLLTDIFFKKVRGERKGG